MWRLMVGLLFNNVVSLMCFISAIASYYGNQIQNLKYGSHKASFQLIYQTQVKCPKLI